MSITLAPPTSPLRIDETGTIRLGTTRVSLDTIVSSFNAGMTPEQMAEGFPSVSLADLYSAVAYYLSHREQIDDYIGEGDRAAEAVLAQSPELFPSDVRQRLRVRQMAR